MDNQIEFNFDENDEKVMEELFGPEEGDPADKPFGLGKNNSVVTFDRLEDLLDTLTDSDTDEDEEEEFRWDTLDSFEDDEAEESDGDSSDDDSRVDPADIHWDTYDGPRIISEDEDSDEDADDACAWPEEWDSEIAPRQLERLAQAIANRLILNLGEVLCGIRTAPDCD